METISQFFPIIILSIVIYFIYRHNKKKKTENDKLKSRLEELIKEREGNISNENSSNSNDSINEKSSITEEESKVLNKLEKESLWKKTRVGLYIFILPHLIISTILSDMSGSKTNNAGVVVIVNFFISRYYIKKQIIEKGKKVDKPILYGLGISFVVFSLQLLLGYIFGIITSR